MSKPFKLFVANFPFNTTEDDLDTFFREFGTVVSVSIAVERDTEASRGFGFVEMAEESDGRKAIEFCKRAKIGKRDIIVEVAKPRPVVKRPTDGQFSPARA